MEATAELTQLDAPIDAMLLIHKALRAEAGRVEEAVNQLELGGSFKTFQGIFHRWALALGYHIAMEECYLSAALPATDTVHTQATEQQSVIDMLEALQTYLAEDLRRMIVIPRTQRQLRSRVIALRIAQEDLLEEEEDQVLPLVRQHMSESQQLEVIRHLLIDDDAEDQREILNWVEQDLHPGERQLLTTLHSRFHTVALA